MLLNEYNLEGEIAARDCFQQAIDLDPDYAPAYAGMAVSYGHEYHSAWCEHPEHTNQKLCEYACKALKFDDNNICSICDLLSVGFYYLNIGPIPPNK